MHEGARVARAAPFALPTCAAVTILSPVQVTQHEAAERERRHAGAVLLSALLLYSTFLWPFEGEVPNRYMDLTRALVEERTVTIDSYHANTSDKARRDGHYYCVAAPGPSFVGAPAHAVVHALGGSPRLGQAAVTLVVGPLAGAIAAAALFLVTGLTSVGGAALSLRDRLWLVAAYAVGTFAFPLATTLYPHALIGAFTAGAMAAVLTHRATGAARSALVAGACAGALTLCDYQCAVLGPVFAAWTVIARQGDRRARARSLLLFCAGAAPPLLLLAAYHTVCFGAPWKTGYHYFGTDELHAIYAQGASGFLPPTAHTLWETSLGGARGLFVFAPPALVGLAVAIASPREARGRAALGVACGVGFLLLNASRRFDWYGGFTWGPRYQAAGLAFWLLPLAHAPRPRWAAPALVAATLAGAAVNLVGAGGRWPQTLAAGFAEVTTFGVQAKWFGHLLGAGPGYHPAGVERLGPQLVALTTLGLLLAGAAAVALWRPGRREWRLAAGVGGAFALLQGIAVSGSFRREPELRRYLREREFISFARHFEDAQNFVVASDLARSHGDAAEAAALAERALELSPGDEGAGLRLALARGDAAAIDSYAAGAQDPAVRALAAAARGRP